MEKLFGKAPDINTNNTTNVVNQEKIQESSSTLIEEIDPILE
jgi:hypothetical protein